MTITSITFSDNFSTWKDRFNQVVNEVNSTINSNTITSGASSAGPAVNINIPSEKILLARTAFAPINGILSNGSYVGESKVIFVEDIANATTLILAIASNSNLIIPQSGSTITASANQFVKLIWNGSKWLVESYDATIA